MSDRPQIRPGAINAVIGDLQAKIRQRLNEKTEGSFASSHETLGIVTEEYHELIRAVQGGNLWRVNDELLDVAVACILGIACVKGGTLDW